MSAVKKRAAAVRKPATANEKAARPTTRAAKARPARPTASAAAGPVHVGAAVFADLVEQATAARENAHAPYSKYKVGAAILTRSGKTFRGCNVENASLGATICAERGAILQMVAAGEREPIACAIVTRDGASPCGICRQVLSEFATEMPMLLVGLEEGEAAQLVDLKDLLPLAFRLR